MKSKSIIGQVLLGVVIAANAYAEVPAKKEGVDKPVQRVKHHENANGGIQNAPQVAPGTRGAGNLPGPGTTSPPAVGIQALKPPVAGVIPMPAPVPVAPVTTLSGTPAVDSVTLNSPQMMVKPVTPLTIAPILTTVAPPPSTLPIVPIFVAAPPPPAVIQPIAMLPITTPIIPYIPPLVVTPPPQTVGTPIAILNPTVIGGSTGGTTGGTTTGGTTIGGAITGSTIGGTVGGAAGGTPSGGTAGGTTSGTAGITIYTVGTIKPVVTNTPVVTTTLVTPPPTTFTLKPTVTTRPTVLLTK